MQFNEHKLKKNKHTHTHTHTTPEVTNADEVNEQHHEFFAEKPTQYRSAEELNLLSSAACGSCYSGRSRSNEMNSNRKKKKKIK